MDLKILKAPYRRHFIHQFLNFNPKKTPSQYKNREQKKFPCQYKRIKLRKEDPTHGAISKKPPNYYTAFPPRSRPWMA
jgi:hypothetical protein